MKSKRVCRNGHEYEKSSDCPVCPFCEKISKPQRGFLSLLSAPARRALEAAGVTSVEKLARYTESEILQLHGMGAASIPKLNNILEAEGLTFRK